MFSFGSLITFLASTMIPDEPGFIVGPISWVLGGILNFVFNIIYFITENFSLGISIIVVTIIARCLMLPLAFKQQKSMVIMRKIQPKIKAIQDKYKDDLADPEVKRKMNTEMQKLYSENKYNPLSGCLPLLIQLPIFIALYYIMQNPYAFIDTINDTYKDISTVVISEVNEDKDAGIKLYEKSAEIEKIKAKEAGSRSDEEKKLLSEYESNKYVFWCDFWDGTKNPDNYNMIPSSLQTGEDGEEFDILEEKYVIKAFDKFNAGQWEQVKAVFGGDVIDTSLAKKEKIEFFGVNLTEVAGFGFPGIFITALSCLTTFLSSWLMMRKNKDMGSAAQSQQKIMMITMPLIMAWITSGLPCGVGLYWIASNIFMIVQQQFLNTYYEKKLIEEDTKGSKNKVVIDEVPKKSNKKGKIRGDLDVEKR